MFLLLLILIFDNSTQKVTTFDRVIYQEYYQDGKHNYNQLIFYNYSPDYKRYHVCGYKLIYRHELINIYSKTGDFHNFRLEENDKVYYFKTKIFICVSSEVDLEKENKKVFPEKYRIGIFK